MNVTNHGFLRMYRRPALVPIFMCMACLVAATWSWAAEPPEPGQAAAPSAKIEVSETQLKSAGIRCSQPLKAKFAVDIKLTGRVALNEDRLAHIFPL